MWRHGWLLLAVVVATLVGGPQRAHAEPFPLRMSFGFKAGGGGNLQLAPDNVPAGVTPLDDGAGGWGVQLGPYAQCAILDGLLALELGLNYDFGANWSAYTLNNAEYDVGWNFATLRIPLLLEVGTPGTGTRLSFGTGPEFGIGMGAEGTVDPDPPVAVYFVDGYDAGDEGGTAWLFNLGAEFPVSMVRVTFDIRYALHLGVPSDYADRLGPPYVARQDMDLRLLLGVAYDYTLLLD